MPLLPLEYNTPLIPITSAELEGSHILATEPSVFYGGEVTIGDTAGYLMLFDADAVPADGAVTPLKVWTVAAKETFNVNCPMPIACNVGAVVVFSTTGPFTKTISATACFSFQVSPR